MALAASVLALPLAPAGAEPANKPAAPPVPESACDGLQTAALASGQVICSHGPDHPHAFAAAEGDEPSTAAAASGIACFGDGKSGNRVQAVYARASDVADRYSTYLDTIRGLVAEVDSAIDQSAGQLGYTQRVRWAHTNSSSCQATVLNLELPSNIDDSYSTALKNTINGLYALGHDDPSRKYLVFVDAATLCGQAQIYSDDSASSSNRNNGGVPGMVARVDLGFRGCANGLTATHELVHTLGGVQLSAPHSTGTYSGGGGGWHCNDEYDALCYADGGSTGTSAHMTYPCASSEQLLLDCNDDDYYHPAPVSGSYLAKHWNTARSAWLTAPALSLTTSDPVDPSILSAPSAVVGKAGRGSVAVSWAAPLSDGGSPISGYTVTASPGGKTASGGPTATSATVSGLADGRYTFTVTATNEGGSTATSAPSPTVALYRGGYVVDRFGGLHKLTIRGNPSPPSTTGGPYWGHDIARAVVQHPRGGGYVVDGWGGIHPYSAGDIAPPRASNGPYWVGRDIVRGAVAHPAGGGYIVDGWGGIHTFSTGGVSPPRPGNVPYWPGWDVVRGIVLHPAGGGYVVDAWGVLHAFSTGGKMPPKVKITGYWKGWDIARGVVMLRDGSGGYVVDGWGGRHGFSTGSNPLPPATSGPYWLGQDIARGADL